MGHAKAIIILGLSLPTATGLETKSTSILSFWRHSANGEKTGLPKRD